MPEHVVVVGAGQAGASLVAKLRGLGHSGRITLIGDEPALPYQRPPLSKKYLLGEVNAERLLLRPESFYDENEIEVRTGVTVQGVDLTNQEIILENGALAYDLLALTTGSTPRTLPAAIGGKLHGVYTVRTLADVDGMVDEFATGRHALVIGGGYIGLEAAAVARKMGVNVTLVEMAPRILNRVAAPETADFFRALHTENGVDLRENVGLSELIGNEGRVTGAQLSDGTELQVDFVIAGIGILPETGLAEAAGLEIDNGIATDARGRTSDHRVFAAGDCASFPWHGERMRLESVQNAIDQAEHVAGAMLGSLAPYLPQPWFWSDQYDCKLQIAGLNTGYDKTVSRPGSRPTGRSIWYYRGTQLLAVDAINDPKAYMTGKRWIEAGQSPASDRIADAATDLRQAI
ncbi:MAG: NAD(P)/FAD-dependent oxidoreductase [Paracoccaceae bacterium]